MDPYIARLRVRTYELDSLGHVNHAVYLNWFEHARMEVLDRVGLPLDELFRRKWLPTVVRIEVDYRAEARVGAELRVETAMGEIGRSSFVIHQKLLAEKDDRLLAEARVVAVLVGADGSAMPVPDEMRRLLATPPAEPTTVEPPTS